MKLLTRTILVSVVLAFALPSAHAEEGGSYSKADWPLKLTHRPLLLAKNMLEIRGDTLRINLSEGQSLEPISLAPDVYFGITKRITVGVTHDRGVCLTGTEGRCPKTYNDLGLEALFSLMGRGSFQAAAVGGLVVPSLSDPTAVGLKLGFLTRLRAGSMGLFVDPWVYVAASESDVYGHQLIIPARLVLQVNTQTAVLLESGLADDLEAFGDNFIVPVGVGANFAINEKLDFGALFRLGNVASTDGAVEARELVARMALRL